MTRRCSASSSSRRERARRHDQQQEDITDRHGHTNGARRHPLPQHKTIFSFVCWSGAMPYTVTVPVMPS